VAGESDVPSGSARGERLDREGHAGASRRRDFGSSAGAKAHVRAPGRGDVKLSAFTVVDDLGPDRDRYREVLELATTAESAGLSGIWVAEHHFNPSGLCPSPPVLLAACAARTRRLRLGSLVSVLTFHRAVDVAEEYSLLDRISGGRVNLGLGSGYIPTEFEGFGIDPAARHERFDRAYATVIDAMAGHEVNVGEPGARPVRLNVLPVQSPHPPLWIAVQRREAIPFVARRGASVALIPYATVQDREELAAEIREFRSALPPHARAEVAAAVHIYVGAHPDRARRAFREYLTSRLRTQSTHYQAKAARDPHHASPEALESAGFALFGSVEEVAPRLRELSAVGVDEVLGIFDFGGLAPDDALGSVRALGPTFGPPAPSE
jgi:alkanesulfonate monooxygenase SsuD/methylene tetrahydromethanopterin reductase-like flavin-dependent oxidoreductase (luciferase family)